MAANFAMKARIVVQCLAVITSVTSLSSAETITFQQGVNGYQRAQDTSVRWMFSTNFGDTAEEDKDHPGDIGAYEMWSTGAGRTSVLEVGHFFQTILGGVGGSVYSLEAGPAYRYSRMYIRFRDVFGTGSNQVSPDAEIQSATLRLYNTEDLGAVKAAGGAGLGETVTGPAGETIVNQRAEPKLNSGTIGIYPSLIPISYGFDDGLSTKGKVTGRERRRSKERWSQVAGVHGGECFQNLPPFNDPSAMQFLWGPADFDNPCIAEGENEFDSSHPGAIEVLHDANKEFKEFDVTGLIDFITGDGVYIRALSPSGELPTLDINYGNAYHSSEFGNTYDKDGNLVLDASAEDIATRPILVIELAGSAMPGDADGNGVVDVADLGVVGANFGSTNATLEDGDFTGDGSVDVADLGVVGANWTAAQAAGNGSALVPEPTTLLLVVMSVLVVGCRRR